MTGKANLGADRFTLRYFLHFSAALRHTGGASVECSARLTLLLNWRDGATCPCDVHLGCVGVLPSDPDRAFNTGWVTCSLKP